MCIASFSIGTILTSIWNGILWAAEAVADAVLIAADSVGGALGITGGSSAAGAGASTAGAGASTVGTGVMASGAPTLASTTQGIGYSVLGASVTTGPFNTIVPTLTPSVTASTTSTAVTASTAGLSVPWGTIGSVGLTALGAGAGMAGSLISTMANMQNNAAQQDVMKYLAAQEEVNGILASRQGEHIDLQSNQDRLQLHNKMLQTQGDARASFAARGVVLGSGTPNDYEADIADAYDLDSRNLEYDVAMKKWKYKVEAANHFTQAGIYRNQAAAYKSASTASLLGGMFNTAGSALSGLSSGLTVSSKLGWI